jgi:hypothetical protein
MDRAFALATAPDSGKEAGSALNLVIFGRTTSIRQAVAALVPRVDENRTPAIRKPEDGLRRRN